MEDLQGKVVVISGAAGALGGAVAHAFEAAGAKLALLDRRHDRLQSVCGALAGNPDHLLLGDIDMTKEDDVGRITTEIIERFGRVDALVNAIGGYRAGRAITETPLDLWEGMLALNARSVFLAMREVLPHMVAQGYGSVINVAARPGLRAPAKAAAYAASKSAVIRLTEGASAEVKHKGVRVNCILPGTIDTPANREAMPDAKHDRWVEPRAVADLVLFLASDASRGIYGAAIPVYGTG